VNRVFAGVRSQTGPQEFPSVPQVRYARASVLPSQLYLSQSQSNKEFYKEFYSQSQPGFALWEWSSRQTRLGPRDSPAAGFSMSELSRAEAAGGAVIFYVQPGDQFSIR